MLGLLPSALHLLLTLTIWPPEPAPNPARAAGALQFHLRHEHALSFTSRNIFRDVPSTSQLVASDALSLSTSPVTVHRPNSRAAFRAARARWRSGGYAETLEWDDTEVQAPNVSSRTTLQTLAKMTNNAYSEPGDKEWYDIGSDWDVVSIHVVPLKDLGKC